MLASADRDPSHHRRKFCGVEGFSLSLQVVPPGHLPLRPQQVLSYTPDSVGRRVRIMLGSTSHDEEWRAVQNPGLAEPKG